MNWKNKLETIEVGDLVYYIDNEGKNYCIVTRIKGYLNSEHNEIWGKWTINITGIPDRPQTIGYMFRKDCILAKKGVQ